MFMFKKSLELPAKGQALPGRPNPIATAAEHFVNGHPLKGPYPQGSETAIFGMGCFWGAERKFWQLRAGVYVDRGRLRRRRDAESDLRGGLLRPDRSQRSGARGLRPEARSPTRSCSQTFWESHDPTQGMRQGNDVGTQYRSGIYTIDAAQQQAAEQSQGDATPRRWPPRRATAPITTEILDAPPFYFAEDYHQQYLAQEPERLLRTGRHRRVVPDRHRRGCRAVKLRQCDAQGLRRQPLLLRSRAISWGPDFLGA